MGDMEHPFQNLAKTVAKDLAEMGLTWREAVEKTQDRARW